MTRGSPGTQRGSGTHLPFLSSSSHSVPSTSIHRALLSCHLTLPHYLSPSSLCPITSPPPVCPPFLHPCRGDPSEVLVPQDPALLPMLGGASLKPRGRWAEDGRSGAGEAGGSGTGKQAAPHPEGAVDHSLLGARC